MGPTYLVLLRVGDTATVLYDGDSYNDAFSKSQEAYRAERDKCEVDNPARIYLTTVRAEARLS